MERNRKGKKMKLTDIIETTENKSVKADRFFPYGYDSRYMAKVGNDLYVKRKDDKYELLAKNYTIEERKKE